MKMMLLAALVGLCGCSTVSELKDKPGGTIGAVQSADDALAARYGVSPEMTARIRKALGIIDTRTLPDASRVLPAGYTWKQDILDKDGKVVDLSTLRKGLPYIVPDGSQADSAVTMGDVFAGQAGGLSPQAASMLEQILGEIEKDPTLLEAVGSGDQ